MQFHPNLLHFGRLTLYEVYEFYDSPVLVSCQSNTGSLYLAVSVQALRDAEKWLYVSISKERLTQVRTGDIDLRSAFAQPEDGVAFLANVPHDEKLSARIEILELEAIRDDLLPAIGEFLSLPAATLPELEPIVDRARKERRDVLRVALKLPTILRTEAPAKLLGMMLSSLQDMLNAIGQAITGESTKRGAVSKDTIAGNEMMVTAFGAGSFEVELVSSQYADLFDQTDVTATLEEFVKVVATGSNADELQNYLRRLRARAAGSYLNFLRSIDKGVERTIVRWASPGGEERRVEVSALTVRAAIAIIEDETLEDRESFTLFATLVGANLRTRTYEVRGEGDDKERYSGKIATEAAAAVKGAVLGRAYNARLRRVLKIQTSTGEEHEEVILVGLDEASETASTPSAVLERSKAS